MSLSIINRQAPRGCLLRRLRLVQCLTTYLLPTNSSFGRGVGRNPWYALVICHEMARDLVLCLTILAIAVPRTKSWLCSRHVCSDLSDDVSQWRSINMFLKHGSVLQE